jgi:hypothetical protein
VVALSAGCAQKDGAIRTETPDGTSASPSGGAVANRDRSMVRVVNAVIGGPEISLHAGDLSLFDGVDASEVTPYKEIEDNAVKFTAHPAGHADGMVEAVNREMMADGERYTAVVLPNDKQGAASLRILRDELTPSAGKARIRVINAAVGMGELDVKIAGHDGDLFNGINFGNEGGFKDIDPATVTLVVRRENGKAEVATVTDLRLEAGTAYTIVVVGGPQAPLKTITVKDQTVPRNLSLK